MMTNDDNNNRSELEKNIYNKILSENGVSGDSLGKFIQVEKTKVEKTEAENVKKKNYGCWVCYLCCCCRCNRNAVAATDNEIIMGSRNSTPVIPITPPLQEK